MLIWMSSRGFASDEVGFDGLVGPANEGTFEDAHDDRVRFAEGGCDLAVADLDHDGVDEHHRIPGRRPVLRSVSSPSTRSVILDIVSREMLAEYTSARCASTSPVVSPLPVSESHPGPRALPE